MWMPKPPGPRSLAGSVMSGAGADVGSNGRPPSTNVNVNVP